MPAIAAFTPTPRMAAAPAAHAARCSRQRRESSSEELLRACVMPLSLNLFFIHIVRCSDKAPKGFPVGRSRPRPCSNVVGAIELIGINVRHARILQPDIKSRLRCIGRILTTGPSRWRSLRPGRVWLDEIHGLGGNIDSLARDMNSRHRIRGQSPPSGPAMPICCAARCA